MYHGEPSFSRRCLEVLDYLLAIAYCNPKMEVGNFNSNYVHLALVFASDLKLQTIYILL